MSDYTSVRLPDCFVEAQVLCDGWVIIRDDEGNKISLGRYPNKRFKIIEEAIKVSQNIKIASCEVEE